MHKFEATSIPITNIEDKVVWKFTSNETFD